MSVGVSLSIRYERNLPEGVDPRVSTARTIAAVITKSPEQSRILIATFLDVLT
jgi:hypothetical protein